MLSFFPLNVLDEIWDLIEQFLRVFLPSQGDSTRNLVSTGSVALRRCLKCHIIQVLGHRSKNDLDLLYP